MNRLSAYPARAARRTRGLLRRLRAAVRSRLARLRKHTKQLRKRARRFRKRYLPEVLYTLDMDIDPGGVAIHPDYELVEADADRLDEMRRDSPKDLPERKHRILRERLAVPTERCWLILDEDGTGCGYCHVAFDDHLNERINYPIEVGPSQVYLFDDHVFRKYRRRGLHAFSIGRRLEIVAEMGFTRARTQIARRNTSSRASYGKFGTRVAEVVVHLPPLNRSIRVR